MSERSYTPDEKAQALAVWQKAKILATQLVLLMPDMSENPGIASVGLLYAACLCDRSGREPGSDDERALRGMKEVIDAAFAEVKRADVLIRS